LFHGSPLYIDFNDRFADRDMLMRYHWGLGIGHVYSHEDDRFQQSSTIIDCEADCEGAGIQDMVNEDSADSQCQTRSLTPEKNACDSEFEDNDPELASGMGAPNDDDFSDGGSSDSDSESLEQDGKEVEGDEEYLELVDSYYTDY
jgi:hypothetical protein